MQIPRENDSEEQLDFFHYVMSAFSDPAPLPSSLPSVSPELSDAMVQAMLERLPDQMTVDEMDQSFSQLQADHAQTFSKRPKVLVGKLTPVGYWQMHCAALVPLGLIAFALCSLKLAIFSRKFYSTHMRLTLMLGTSVEQLLLTMTVFSLMYDINYVSEANIDTPNEIHTRLLWFTLVEWLRCCVNYIRLFRMSSKLTRVKYPLSKVNRFLRNMFVTAPLAVLASMCSSVPFTVVGAISCDAESMERERRAHKALNMTDEQLLSPNAVNQLQLCVCGRCVALLDIYMPVVARLVPNLNSQTMAFFAMFTLRKMRRFNGGNVKQPNSASVECSVYYRRSTKTPKSFCESAKGFFRSQSKVPIGKRTSGASQKCSSEKRKKTAGAGNAENNNNTNCEPLNSAVPRSKAGSSPAPLTPGVHHDSTIRRPGSCEILLSESVANTSRASPVQRKSCDDSLMASKSCSAAVSPNLVNRVTGSWKRKHSNVSVAMSRVSCVTKNRDTSYEKVLHASYGCALSAFVACSAEILILLYTGDRLSRGVIGPETYYGIFDRRLPDLAMYILDFFILFVTNRMFQEEVILTLWCLRSDAERGAKAEKTLQTTLKATVHKGRFSSSHGTHSRHRLSGSTAMHSVVSTCDSDETSKPQYDRGRRNAIVMAESPTSRAKRRRSKLGSEDSPTNLLRLTTKSPGGGRYTKRHDRVNSPDDIDETPAEETPLKSPTWHLIRGINRRDNEGDNDREVASPFGTFLMPSEVAPTRRISNADAKKIRSGLLQTNDGVQEHPGSLSAHSRRRYGDTASGRIFSGLFHKTKGLNYNTRAGTHGANSTEENLDSRKSSCIINIISPPATSPPQWPTDTDAVTNSDQHDNNTIGNNHTDMDITEDKVECNNGRCNPSTSAPASPFGKKTNLAERVSNTIT